jgi:hypothetical protein
MSDSKKAREAIEQLWPEHAPHLPPQDNALGQPRLDPDLGVVCNCRKVLGFPGDTTDMSGDDPADESTVAEYVDVELPDPPLPERAVIPEDPLGKQISVIDPTLPYGPADVERQLISVTARLERGAHFQRAWEERAHEAGVAYELAYARALVNAAGPADVRKAAALLQCQPEFAERELCIMMVRAVRETMHTVRALLSGYQTIARSVGSSTDHPYGHGA